MAQFSNQIQDLRVAGVSSEDIIKTLKLSKPTFYRYLAQFQADWIATEGAAAIQLAMDFYNARKQEILELTQIKREAGKKDKDGKMASYKIFMEMHNEIKWLEDNLIVRMMELGYAPRAKVGPQIAIQNNQTNNSVALDAFRELNYGTSIKSRTNGKVEQSG